MAQPVKPPTVSALAFKAQPVRKRSKAPALSSPTPVPAALISVPQVISSPCPGIATTNQCASSCPSLSTWSAWCNGCMNVASQPWRWSPLACTGYPLFEMLDAAGFEVHLVNARHVRNVPGRKSDVLDCQWLQQLMSYGLLRGGFRPAPQS